MRAKINSIGYLEITTESEVEVFALDFWIKNAINNNNSLKVDMIINMVSDVRCKDDVRNEVNSLKVINVADLGD